MRTGIVFALLLLATQVNAEADIYTINLKHRLAADVMPQIEAFLPESATIRAYGDMLILKSDRATLANVEQLLSKLDVAQKSVVISVMRSNDTINQQRGGSTQLDIEASEDIRGGVAINRWSTKDNTEQNQHYRARGVAGQPVSISLGEELPQRNQLVFVDSYGGVSVADDTHYIATVNGFKAVPFLLPDNQIRVEIHPFFSHVSTSNDEIRSSDVITTIVGNIGEWLEVGRITENAEQVDHGVTTYRSHGSQQQFIYLKVETSSK